MNADIVHTQPRQSRNYPKESFSESKEINRKI